MTKGVATMELVLLIHQVIPTASVIHFTVVNTVMKVIEIYINLQDDN